MQNDTRTAGQKIADEYYESTELTKPRLARMIDASRADRLERLKSEQMVEKVARRIAEKRFTASNGGTEGDATIRKDSVNGFLETTSPTKPVGCTHEYCSPKQEGKRTKFICTNCGFDLTPKIVGCALGEDSTTQSDEEAYEAFAKENLPNLKETDDRVLSMTACNHWIVYAGRETWQAACRHKDAQRLAEDNADWHNRKDEHSEAIEKTYLDTNRDHRAHG